MCVLIHRLDEDDVPAPVWFNLPGDGISECEGLDFLVFGEDDHRGDAVACIDPDDIVLVVDDIAHPRIELLKKKGLIAMSPEIPTASLTCRDFLQWVSTQAKAMAPLVRWLVFATA